MTPDKLRLGGMALLNGLLVHGPTHWAAAARRPDGTIAVASGVKPRLRRFDGVAGMRGVARLAEAMAVIPLVKRALPEARLPFQDTKVLVAMAGAAAGGRALRGALGGSSLGSEAAVAAVSVLPGLVALRGGDLAAYHGVEHKAITAYENDDDPAGAAKEHDRCGSHLMAPLLASNVAGAALLRQAVTRPGPAAQAAVGIASIGVAVEAFAWAERHAGSRAARAFRRPGHELQRVVGTREPTDEQLDVGRAALTEILRAEGAA